MTKKMRDSAYVNDLVVLRNACEEKKLRFTIDQIENLKTIYSRQKEQEKMYFAVQHMAVPVKTDSVILNLRKGLHLDSAKGGRRSSRLTSTPVLTNVDDHLTPGRSVSKQFERDHTQTPGSQRVSGSAYSKKNNGTVGFKQSADSHKQKLRTSRRVISPHPNKRKNRIQGNTRTPESRSVSYLDTPASLEQEESQSNLNVEDVEVKVENTGKEETQDDLPSDFANFSLSSHKTNTWNNKSDDQCDKYYVPRLRDLPPVTINIYENPCGEREAKERWQQIVRNIRSSTIRDTRNEVEQTKQNLEIRKKWQTTYKEIKRDRITAMVKDSLKMQEGEQMTLVKFLPKSRQSTFIKEAQLAQHKI